MHGGRVVGYIYVDICLLSNDPSFQFEHNTFFYFFSPPVIICSYTHLRNLCVFWSLNQQRSIELILDHKIYSNKTNLRG
ncbi:hypothetical protein HanRHA438_Chr13g0619851 [Helianthus annuus]|nr:hypothetical protein HanRHA438_Chr13g0619851 [Helianthus annuus]